jgi:hypothetical protein
MEVQLGSALGETVCSCDSETLHGFCPHASVGNDVSQQSNKRPWQEKTDGLRMSLHESITEITNRTRGN